MNAIRKTVALLLLSGLFSGVYAQRVYKRPDNRVFLDLTQAVGMPAEAITQTAKYTGTYIGKEDQFLADKRFADSENERAFQKLEIAPGDLDENGQVVTTGVGKKMTWPDAYEKCKAANING